MGSAAAQTPSLIPQAANLVAFDNMEYAILNRTSGIVLLTILTISTVLTCNDSNDFL